MAAPAPSTPSIGSADLMSRLQAAFAKRAQEEASPMLDAVSKLEAELSSFRGKVQQHAEERALQVMLSSVGAVVPETSDLKPIRQSLKTHLTALLELLGPFDQGAQEPAPIPLVIEAPPVVVVEAVPEVLPEPVLEAVPEVAQEVLEPEVVEAPILVAEAPQEEPSLFDENEVREALRRVNGLGERKWTAHPLPRLLPLLQAYVAEVRYWMENVPTKSHYHWQLEQAIKMLAAIKYDSGIKEFVRGLAANSTGNWNAIANEAYSRVTKFDKDAEAPLQPKKGTPSPQSPLSPPKSKPSEIVPEATTFSWPALPSLRALLGTNKLFLVGGLMVPEKVTSIRERFGLEIEWVEVYRNKGMVGAFSRLSNGGVGAIILLEKFLGHSTSERVIDICKNRKLLWAFGGNAGVATLQMALDQLDKKAAAAA